MQGDSPTSWLVTWTGDFAPLLSFLIPGILTKITNVKSDEQCLAHNRLPVKEPFWL